MQLAVSRYLAAWNEPDRRTRTRILESCWSAHSVYADPGVHLTGIDALSDHIDHIRLQRPGARLEFVSDIDSHHGAFRFLWRLVRADGTTGDVSVDFGEIGPDGKISRMTGFFGEPPTMSGRQPDP